MAELEFGLLLRATSRGGTLDEMGEINERILAACAEHQLAVWIVDHLQFDDMPLLECTTFLAHTAGRYPGLRYGSIVLGQGFRNPAMIAKIGATLQHLTGGRFILGIGAGWKEDEYRAYGYPYPSPARASRNCTRRCRSSAPSGRPARRPSPASTIRSRTPIARHARSPAPILMIGGAGEKRTLRVVAEHADWWNADYYSPAEYGRKLAILHDHCRAIGRDPSAITPTYYGAVSLSRKPDTTINMPLSHRSDLFTLSGTPDEVTAATGGVRRAGGPARPTQLHRFPAHRRARALPVRGTPRFTRPNPSA